MRQKEDGFFAKTLQVAMEKIMAAGGGDPTKVSQKKAAELCSEAQDEVLGQLRLDIGNKIDFTR